MKQYVGLVHHDKGSAYGVHFPDLPGCFSAADTLDELPAMASEAIALHLEDMEAPEPRSLADLKEDCDFTDELANGAFPMIFPVISLAGRSRTANVSFDAGLLEAIDKTAKARKMTRAAFLAQAARREIENQV